MNIDRIKLEFSESQKCYHYNYWDSGKHDWEITPNTNGYIEICISDSKTLYQFCKIADKEFGPNTTIERLKTLWINYINQLIK